MMEIYEVIGLFVFVTLAVLFIAALVLALVFKEIDLWRKPEGPKDE